VEQVEDSFRFLPVNAFDEELDCGHGRAETRRCSVISDLSLIASKEEWTGLKSLIKSEFAAQNYSLPNRTALNLLKNEKTAKVGIKGKRLKAGWDNDYLIKLIKN
jgi:hypothetical protein